jgi:hypothetical protein
MAAKGFIFYLMISVIFTVLLELVIAARDL